jgi:hypothetical protein
MTMKWQKRRMIVTGDGRPGRRHCLGRSRSQAITDARDHDDTVQPLR